MLYQLNQVDSRLTEKKEMLPASVGWANIIPLM
jgi:hypothetical protein